MRLKDKVAIVTGGGSGIGRAISSRFALEGAIVIIGDIEINDAESVCKEINNNLGAERCIAFKCDVSDPKACDAMVDMVEEKYQQLDILVNNAGISDMCSVTELKNKRWREVMSINLDAHFYLSKRAIPLMQKNNKGRIINIASAMGLMAHKMAAAYSVSKAGVVQLTKQMALDYGKDNITVNAICPGIINTQMTGFMLVDDEINNYYCSVTPRNRIGKPEDVANLALFLSSDESDFITGTAIPVDGGVIAGTDVLLGPK
jgi:NAD(P)-dependent dehydrogenase (short-subunit alcohol dehydrogenase family)